MTSSSRLRLSAVLLLFLGSGCAALIYEVTWLQLLQLTVGSTAIGLATLLATFMGGLCLGSLALPRLARRGWHPLRVYAAVEAGIGLTGALVYWLLPLAGRLYLAGVERGLPDVALRAVFCALCLLPPTLLMGASLPAVARWTEADTHCTAWLGFFYGGNIAGGVIGSLLAGFYLLKDHDALTASLVAAGINAAVALLALALASRGPDWAPEPAAGSAAGAWPVYAAIGISGAAALGAEVVWTRLLALMLGASVYTFSIILAIFLVGLGIGSATASGLLRHGVAARRALAVCQLLLALAVTGAGYLIAVVIPNWTFQATTQPAVLFATDTLRVLSAVLVPAMLWGASFPLALAAVARPGEDAARLAARTYAVNTLGAIAGALVFSLMLIPTFGTRGAGQALAVLSVGAAALAVGKMRWTWAVALALTLVPALRLPGLQPSVFVLGRQSRSVDPILQMLYVGEGVNASVAVSELGSTRYFSVSGKVEASTSEQDMRLERILGHLPAMLHPRPASVLVVGCGAGVTAGSFVTYPALERMVLCEIEPLIPQAAARYFRHQNHKFLEDPRTVVVYDDARHFILRTQEQFDVITSDPIHPWVKGSAALYTEEYFELCKRHLKPGGIIPQWVPLYESSLEAVNTRAYCPGSLKSTLNTTERFCPESNTTKEPFSTGIRISSPEPPRACTFPAIRAFR